MSQTQTRQPLLLQDYRPPAFLSPSIELDSCSIPTPRIVTALPALRAQCARARAIWCCRGEDQELLGLRLDGEPLAGGAIPDRGRRAWSLRDLPDRVHPRGEEPDRPARQHQPDGPLSQQRRVLHPVRAGGLPAHRLVAGPAGRDGQLSRADRGRRQAFPVLLSNGNLLETRRAAGRAALGAVGGPVPQALLSVRAGGRRSRLPRRRVRHPLRPHGAAADLLRARQHRAVPPRHGIAEEVDEVGRGPLRPGVRPRPVPDRRRQRLQFRRHGEQGPQYLQHLGDPGPRRHLDRLRLPERRADHRPRIFPQLDRRPGHLPRLVPADPQGRADRLPRPAVHGSDMHSSCGQADRRRAPSSATPSSPRMPGRSPIRSAPTATSRSTISTPARSTRRAPRSSACCTP